MECKKCNGEGLVGSIICEDCKGTGKIMNEEIVVTPDADIEKVMDSDQVEEETFIEDSGENGEAPVVAEESQE